MKLGERTFQLCEASKQERTCHIQLNGKTNKQCNQNMEIGKRMGQDETGGVMGLMRVLYIRLRKLNTKYVY